MTEGNPPSHGYFEMSRLPVTGASVATPARTEEELVQVLVDLGAGQAFGHDAVHELHSSLAKIVGAWFSEQHRMEVSDVGRELLSVAKGLSDVSRSLGGVETGIHSDLEIAVASRVATTLALDPAVRSLAKAQELIASFRQEAARIAHVCMVTRADLPNRPGQAGRRPLGWYDDFTALLLSVSKKAEVEPSLRKDRISGARSGWLLEAAQAFESFLWPQMRSPSVEACAKRLERSRRHLCEAERQNRGAR